VVLQIIGLVAIGVLIPWPGAAQDSGFDRSSRTGEAVAAAVREAPQLTVFDHVHGSVDDGVVTLTGRVTDASKRDAVRRRVETVEGVREVQDRIAVLHVSRSDEELRERIARTIYGHTRFWRYAMMPRPPIRIIVEAGEVTLAGVVWTDSDRALARALAMQSGARNVFDELIPP
jgi:osmotically-inducible protein OsmY